MRGIATLFLFSALLLNSNAFAQLSYGGSPMGFSADKLTPLSATRVNMPSFDIEAQKAEHDLLHAQSKGPWYFGKNFDTDISTDNAGIWEMLPNGDHLWRVSIKSKKAISINFEFHEYEIPEGGKVFVYTPDMKHILGAFDQRNRVEDNGHGVLGVEALPGSEIVIEYIEPASKVGLGKLKIGQVTHAYRDIWGFAKGLGDSEPCNTNVICAIANNYRPDISSVAMITTGGNGICTGTMINNCAQDSTPYFLTADHCLSASVSGWTFRFHWQSDDCVANNNGPTNYTVSGATLLVNDAGTDVALLELASNIPDTFEVCFAGWDNSGIAPDSVYCIHHPSGDIKKFTPDSDPPTQVTWSGAACWEVAAWDTSTTEPGSSGSGLWSDGGHLIGQLFGGSASCTSNTDDNYGRIDVSWPLLEPYLGMCGPTLDRFCPNGVYGGIISIPNLDVGVSSIQELPSVVCDATTISPKITITNYGTDLVDSVRVNWRWENGPANGALFITQLAPQQTANYFLPAIPVPAGKRDFIVYTSNPNNQVDMDPLNDTLVTEVINYSPSTDITFDLVLDDFGTETTWTLHDADGLLLDEGGPYSNGNGGLLQSSAWCLGNGCYEFTMYDTFGDGICCNQGNGSYSMTDSTGFALFAPNASFGSSIVHQFCLVDVGIDENRNFGQLSIFPNPNDGNFTVVAPQDFVGGTVSVYNPVGQLVTAEPVQRSGAMHLDLGDTPPGLYLLEMRNGGKRSVGRLVVR